MRGGQLKAGARRGARWARFQAKQWVLVRLQSWALGLAGFRSLLCVGDSHILPMLDVQNGSQLRKTRITVEAVGGATASGIQNPNSRTQARPRFTRALQLTTRRHWVLACLGEVDAGFLVFRGDGDPVERCGIALARYFTFLDEAVLRRGRRLVVVNVVPPMIESYVGWEGLRGQRRDVEASWQERSDMTMRWNEAVAAWCVERNVPLLDVYSAVTNSDTGRTREDFANANPDDHHLDPVKHADLLIALLRKLGFQ